MKPLSIGAFSVHSVLEDEYPTLTPDVMFPASTPEAMASHMDWMDAEAARGLISDAIVRAKDAG